MVYTTEELQKTLNQITFEPSGVMLHKMDIRWEIEKLELVVRNASGAQWATTLHGWHVRFNFLRPDVRTGELGRGVGRWEFVPFEAVESTVVKTCWLLLELLVRHELMESFHFQGMKTFDPHRSVDDLVLGVRAGD